MHTTFSSQSKMLTSKHSEVKMTMKDYILFDVHSIRYNAEYLFVDYSINVSNLKTDTAQKKASSRQGIDIQQRIYISNF